MPLWGYSKQQPQPPRSRGYPDCLPCPTPQLCEHSLGWGGDREPRPEGCELFRDPKAKQQTNPLNSPLPPTSRFLKTLRESPKRVRNGVREEGGSCKEGRCGRDPSGGG